jgi:tetratricopeptide (TPR) repeat protein
MYGRVIKCKEQIEYDNEFLSGCKKTFPDNDSAVRHHLLRGWEYLNNNDLNTSMKRFNQAWLLDSSRADIYWGFGALMGKKNNFKASVDFFERALALQKMDASAIIKGNLWRDAALSYENYFYETKEIHYLNISIKYLKKSLEFNPDNPMAYHDLTVAYFYHSQNDSARKYMNLSDKYNPKFIPEELRKLITK